MRLDIPVHIASFVYLLLPSTFGHSDMRVDTFSTISFYGHSYAIGLEFTSFIIFCNMILWTFTCDYNHQYMVVGFYGHYVRIEPLTHVFSVASVFTPTKFSVVLPSSLWGRGYDSKASHHTYDITHHVHWIKCCLGVVVVVTIDI